MIIILLENITPFKIYKKRLNIPRVSWNCSELLKNDFVSILIVNNEIVGTVTCEIIKNEVKTKNLKIKLRR